MNKTVIFLLCVFWCSISDAQCAHNVCCPTCLKQNDDVFTSGPIQTGPYGMTRNRIGTGMLQIGLFNIAQGMDHSPKGRQSAEIKSQNRIKNRRFIFRRRR